MICLAREQPPSPLDDVKANTTDPSSVYISYDNGDSFEDKTSLFNVEINGQNKSSSIDQFITNPKYNTVSKSFVFIFKSGMLILWSKLADSS